MIKDCPFCEEEGCCFCEHSGRVKIGVGEAFETEDQFRVLVARVFRNREQMLAGSVDYIKKMRGEEIQTKKYDTDYTIEDW